MFKMEKDILQGISRKLSSNKRVFKVIAYGSRVRGDFEADSDLDVLVVVDKKNREIKEKILDIFYSYELKTEISFSVSILSKGELEFNERLGSPFIKEIKKEGLILYDSERRREKSALKISS